MAKYVPPNQRGSVSEPNQRGSVSEPNQRGSVSEPNQTTSQRWKRDDVHEPGTLKPLRQSSTVADVSKQMSSVTLDDFPALPTRKAVTLQPQPVARATYASLASNWAEKAKENEEKEKAKKEAEDALKKRQAKTDVKIIPVRQSVVAKKRVDSDDEVELDIGCHVSDKSEYSDPSEVEYEVEEEEEEEEEEEDPDAFWTQRKHKGDIY
jgi:hypothetical protein